MLERLKKLSRFGKLILILPLILMLTLVSCGDAVDSLLGDGNLEDAILNYIDENVDDYHDETVPDPSPSSSPDTAAQTEAETESTLPEDGSYTTKEDVALYIHLYGRLPSNFITKREAEELGWSGGSLEPYAPGMCIGGDRFGNYEGLLPKKKGRTYTECDIDTRGQSKRGAKRIVFSNDGLIYYTDDHYESFELLYGAAD